MGMARPPTAHALGRALRHAREDGGLTLRELGAKLERDHGVISRWETGERTPRPDQVAQFLTFVTWSPAPATPR
jgi:transcriptional regulator with XRE-family HTH domain